MKRTTCGECKHLRRTAIRGVGASIIGCGKTGFVVPHHAEYELDVATFWRAPIECPLPSDCVIKSEEKANPSDWVKMKISDIEVAK